jgi:hypothetical protein
MKPALFLATALLAASCSAPSPLAETAEPLERGSIRFCRRYVSAIGELFTTFRYLGSCPD